MSLENFSGTHVHFISRDGARVNTGVTPPDEQWDRVGGGEEKKIIYKEKRSWLFTSRDNPMAVPLFSSFFFWGPFETDSSLFLLFDPDRETSRTWRLRRNRYRQKNDER